MVWDIDAISNKDLSFNDIPAADSGWDVIQQFALTFDGYSYWGSFDGCGDIANESSARYGKDGVIPATLEHLRTALLFEQRRWRHFGYDPDDGTMVYIRALIGGIQEIVGRREAAEFEMMQEEQEVQG